MFGDKIEKKFVESSDFEANVEALIYCFACSKKRKEKFYCV